MPPRKHALTIRLLHYRCLAGRCALACALNWVRGIATVPSTRLASGLDSAKCLAAARRCKARQHERRAKCHVRLRTPGCRRALATRCDKLRAYESLLARWSHVSYGLHLPRIAYTAPGPVPQLGSLAPSHTRRTSILASGPATRTPRREASRPLNPAPQQPQSLECSAQPPPADPPQPELAEQREHSRRAATTPEAPRSPARILEHDEAHAISSRLSFGLTRASASAACRSTDARSVRSLCRRRHASSMLHVCRPAGQ
jgi:hypothetical protein